MSCKCSYQTDEFHGWGCKITGGECMFCIPAHLHEVPPQAGEVLDENQVDNAFPGILQHFQKSGPLEVATTVPIVTIGLGLHPAIEHSKLGQKLPLIFDADGFISRDVVPGLGRVGGIIHAQAAVNTHFVELVHTAARLSWDKASSTQPT